MTKIDLSIVTTFYNNADSIDKFFDKIKKVIIDLKKQFNVEKISLIIVNDGSEIAHYNLLKTKISKINLKIKLISHNNNYGQHNAIITGLSNTTGEYVVLINFDLDEDPSYIIDIFNIIYKDKKIDSAVCYQKFKYNNLKNITSSFFWKLYNLKKKNHNYFLNRPRTLRIMKKNIVDQIIDRSTSDSFFENTFRETVNFNFVKAIEISIKESSSGYNFFRRLKLSINAIYSMSQSFLDLYLFIFVAIASISFFISLIYLFKFIFYYNVSTVSGFPSLIISIWLLNSVIIAGISFIIHILLGIKNKTNKKIIYKTDEN